MALPPGGVGFLPIFLPFFILKVIVYGKIAWQNDNSFIIKKIIIFPSNFAIGY
jgi:hypothetical protein